MKQFGMLQKPDLAQKTHDGDKDVTRRVIVPQPKDILGTLMHFDLHENARSYPVTFYGPFITGPPVYTRSKYTPKPKYRPGDIVSIKETHWRWGYKEKNAKGNWALRTDTARRPQHLDLVLFEEPSVYLGFTPECPSDTGYHKRPAIFLPFDLARTHVKILDVRPERLQEITEDDARREGTAGVTGCACGNKGQKVAWCRGCGQGCFWSLWDSINAARGHPWANNDYVWRYEYERTEAPKTT